MLFQSYFSKKICFTLYQSTSKLLSPPLPVSTTRVEAGELDRAAWGNWPVSTSTPRWRLKRLRALLEATNLWACPHEGEGWRGWGRYWRQLTCEHIHTRVKAGEVKSAAGELHQPAEDGLEVVPTPGQGAAPVGVVWPQTESNSESFQMG
jgi:hypothetical protein